MIQDIFPSRLEHTFRNLAPALEDCFFSFRNEKVLLRVREDGSRELPTFRDLQKPIEKIRDLTVFLFCVDDIPIYLLQPNDIVASEGQCLRYFPVESLNHILPEWVYFAGITALHLGHWYERNVYCGKCGDRMERNRNQRELTCHSCGSIVYPHIAPVVMVAVINEDRLLMTKYADRSLSQWVLISGFVEIGETLEEAAKREVFEETGIHIKDLKYFGSQPWGFSNSVIVGYIARLDGSDEIHLDKRELAVAEWHSRSNLPQELTDISIAYEMIEALRIHEKGGLE